MTIDYKKWKKIDKEMAREASITATRGLRIRDPDRVFGDVRELPALFVTCPVCDENKTNTYYSEESVTYDPIEHVLLRLTGGTYVSERGTAVCYVDQFCGECKKCGLGLSYWPTFYPVEDWSWAVGICIPEFKVEMNE